MSLSITDLDEFHQYFNGVMSRTAHHAPNVDEIIFTIVGGVLWKATHNIKVREQDGETKNILWFNVGDKRYTLRYEHGNGGSIELLSGTLQGSFVARFDNQTTLSAVRQVFSTL